jgi:hypothetical protein
MARHPLPLRFIAARRAESQAKRVAEREGFPNLDNRIVKNPAK